MDSDGKMAGVIFGMMNFPGLRFVPSKKEKKKKKAGSVSIQREKKKKMLEPFANVKRSRLLFKVIPFFVFLKE